MSRWRVLAKVNWLAMFISGYLSGHYFVRGLQEYPNDTTSRRFVMSLLALCLAIGGFNYCVRRAFKPKENE